MNDPERSKNLEAACDTLRKTGVTLESAPKKYGTDQPVLRDIRNDFYGVLQQVKAKVCTYLLSLASIVEMWCASYDIIRNVGEHKQRENTWYQH